MYLTLKWVVVKSDNSVSFKDSLSKKIVLVHSFGSLATETDFESSIVVEHIKAITDTCMWLNIWKFILLFCFLSK